MPNDYTSMTYDNTYAFNCRYVVGAESSKRMSPHAYGFAVDIEHLGEPGRRGQRHPPERAGSPCTAPARTAA